MDSEKNIEWTGGGIQCDNPECDWKDMSVTFEALEPWLNKPCPKCGHNLLTQEDYDNAKLVNATIGVVNGLSQPELKDLAAMLGAYIPEELMDQKIHMQVSTHKKISINITPDPANE